jgi:hypothetical protein
VAVLVEAISVIIRADRLDPFGGWEAFKAIVPNDTLCADNELVRVGFMSPTEVRRFVEVLRSHGLAYAETGPAQDIVIADQQRGFTTPCNWAEFGHINWENDPKQRVAAARMSGSRIKQVLTPDGWTYGQSLSREYCFMPTVPDSATTATNSVREQMTGDPEDGLHRRGITVKGAISPVPKSRPSFWDRLRGRR